MIEPKRLLQTAATSICVPRSSGGFLPPWQASPSVTGRSDLDFLWNYSVFAGSLSMWYFVSFKRSISLFLEPSSSLSHTGLADLPSQLLWSFSSSIIPLGWGAQYGSLTSWGEPLQLWLPTLLYVTYLGMWVLTILQLHCSYPSHCSSFLISSVGGNLFC